MIIRIPRSPLGPDSETDLRRIIREVSDTIYNGNLTSQVSLSSANRRSLYFSVKVGAGTGGLGSRVSASGRRGPWACWHAFRDVLQAVYEAYPDATVRTAFVTYHGAEDFATRFPETAYRDMGNRFAPRSFVSLCRD